MPNTNAPFGLRPTGLNNAPTTPSFSLLTRKMASNQTTACYRGDVMQGLATGYVSPVTGAPLSPVVIGNYAGVFWGCKYLSISQGRRVWSAYWPGSDASGDVEVQMVPLATTGVPQQFLVQALLTPFAFEDVGETVNLSYLAGTAFSGWSKSGVTASQATLGVTAQPWKIVGLASDIFQAGVNGTDNTSNYNQIIVAFNAAAEVGI